MDSDISPFFFLVSLPFENFSFHLVFAPPVPAKLSSAKDREYTVSARSHRQGGDVALTREWVAVFLSVFFSNQVLIDLSISPRASPLFRPLSHGSY